MINQKGQKAMSKSYAWRQRSSDSALWLTFYLLLFHALTGFNHAVFGLGRHCGVGKLRYHYFIERYIQNDAKHWVSKRFQHLLDFVWKNCAGSLLKTRDMTVVLKFAKLVLIYFRILKKLRTLDFHKTRKKSILHNF